MLLRAAFILLIELPFGKLCCDGASWPFLLLLLLLLLHLQTHLPFFILIDLFISIIVADVAIVDFFRSALKFRSRRGRRKEEEEETRAT